MKIIRACSRLPVPASPTRLTSWASGQFLGYAVGGEASAPLLATAGALARGAGPSELDGQLKGLLQVGHTSGADALAGLIVGLTVGLRLGSG